MTHICVYTASIRYKCSPSTPGATFKFITSLLICLSCPPAGSENTCVLRTGGAEGGDAFAGGAGAETCGGADGGNLGLGMCTSPVVVSAGLVGGSTGTAVAGG